MYTYQMVGLADDNGRTYECKYGTYSKEDGFKFNESINPIVKNGWRNLVNVLFHEDLWKLKKEPIKEMTLQEIEKELGYRVAIKDPEPKAKVVSEERKEEVEETINFLKRWFGLDHIDPEDYY